MTVHWNFVFTQIYSGQNNFECCKKLYVILGLLLAVLGHLGTITCDYTLTGHFIRYTLLVPGWTPILPSERP